MSIGWIRATIMGHVVVHMRHRAHLRRNLLHQSVTAVAPHHLNDRTNSCSNWQGVLVSSNSSHRLPVFWIRVSRTTCLRSPPLSSRPAFRMGQCTAMCILQAPPTATIGVLLQIWATIPATALLASSQVSRIIWEMPINTNRHQWPQCIHKISK